MKELQVSSSNQSLATVSLELNCDQCSIDCEEECQLETHIVKKYDQSKRNGRAFGYALNAKRAKTKLLKGAKREKHLDVEIKSGCANMRFSDGAYSEVVLPLLSVWHSIGTKVFKLNDIEVNIIESDPGIDINDKHMDTKLVIIANNDRLVLHAYNSTQNLMVQGKNFQKFAINYLEPLFTETIVKTMPSIERFNANVLEVLGVNKPTIKQPKGPKPFHCPQCKVKSTTVADLKMHMKSSHSNVIRRNQLVRKVKKNLNENLSLLDVSEHSIATLDEHPHETPQPSNLILEFDECIIMKKHQMPTPKIGTL